MEGIKLEFTEDAMDYIVDQSMLFKLGARGLRSICEAIMTNIMFDLPSQTEIKEFTITREFAQGEFEKSKFTNLKAVA
jgi:ATP-dependent Clp protease ATP-binding subunit ClpX